MAITDFYNISIDSTAYCTITPKTSGTSYSGWQTSAANDRYRFYHGRAMETGSEMYRYYSAKIAITIDSFTGISEELRLRLKTDDAYCFPYDSIAILTEENNISPSSLYSYTYNDNFDGPSTTLLNKAIATSPAYDDIDATDVPVEIGSPQEVDPYTSYFFKFKTNQIEPNTTYYIYILRSGHRGYTPTNYSGYTRSRNNNDDPDNISASLLYNEEEEEEFYQLTVTMSEGIDNVYGGEYEYFTPNTEITLDAAVADGYEFKSWSGDINSTENPVTFTINKNMIVQANAGKIHSLTLYKSTGIQSFTIQGTNNTKKYYSYGTTAYTDCIASPGYHLTKYRGTDWTGTEEIDFYDCAGLTQELGGDWGMYADRTITAYAEPNTYTVTYNANGGSGSMNSSTAIYNSNFLTDKCTFSKIGYRFIGWNEKQDGSGVWWYLDSNGVFESGNPWIWTYTYNIVLYAQWEEVGTYTITYDLTYFNGTTQTQTAFYGESVTLLNPSSITEPINIFNNGEKVWSNTITVNPDVWYDELTSNTYSLGETLETGFQKDIILTLYTSSNEIILPDYEQWTTGQYDFYGYAQDNDLDIIFYPGETVQESMNLYCKWQYKIIYNMSEMDYENNERNVIVGLNDQVLDIDNIDDYFITCYIYLYTEYEEYIGSEQVDNYIGSWYDHYNNEYGRGGQTIELDRYVQNGRIELKPGIDWSGTVELPGPITEDKYGHVFEGWEDREEKIIYEPVTSYMPYKKSTSLYEKWQEAETYTIIYDVSESDFNNFTETYFSNEWVVLHSGYDENGNQFTQQFLITFLDDNGEQLQTDQVENPIEAWYDPYNDMHYGLGEEVYNLADAGTTMQLEASWTANSIDLPWLSDTDEKTFIGWKIQGNPDEEVMTDDFFPYEDTILVPVWEEKQIYTIIYNLSSTFDTSDITEKVEVNADVKLHNGCDEDGQLFSNMYNVTFYDNDEEIDSTFAYEIIGGWSTETNYYDLDSWVNQLGEANDIVNIYPLTNSEAIILPTLTKDNQEFLGWKEDEGTEILPPGYELYLYKHTNLYAVWKQSFNIKYNANFSVQRIVYNGQEVNHLVYNGTPLY